jgi:hypothetical protein
MKIVIEVIPHSSQRYPTVGDWYRDQEDTLHIKVSNMNNSKYEFLVAFHELIEEALCHDREIQQDIVDEYDKKYEAARSENDTSEPGDSKLAPYRKEHFFATSLERLMAAELGVDWSDYDEAVVNL